MYTFHLTVSGPKPEDLQKDEKAFFSILNKGKNTQIAIDTVMARAYVEKLKEMNIPEWRYETKEGAFSCYIDAVEGYVYKSSYELGQRFKLVDSNKLKRDFAEF